MLDLLRAEGLIEQVEEDHSQPCDVTMEKLPLPAPRSAILQTLTRADTGFVSGLAYSDIRGFGMSHPTIGSCATAAWKLRWITLWTGKRPGMWARSLSPRWRG